MADDIFEDDITEEEKAALEAEAEQMGTDDDVVEAASTDDVDAGKADDGDKDQAGDDDKKEADAGKPDADPDADADADAEFKEFQKKFEGKSADEIAKIAFDQTKRANKAGFENRQNAENLKAIQDRAAALVKQRSDEAAAKKADIEARRTKFGEELEQDPDAAAKALNDRMLDREAEQIDAELAEAETEQKVTEAVAFASTYIPEIQTRAPQMFDFAIEMGYPEDEVRSITDGKQLIMLHLAKIGGDMIKGGVIDTAGNFIKMPGGSEEKITDPRLLAEDGPESIGRKPGTNVGVDKDLKQKMQDVLSLSDDEFANLTDDDIMQLTGTA